MTEVQKNFSDLLEKLSNQELDSLEIQANEMMDFREAWMLREDRKNIVGTAHLGGSVTYHWKEEVL